MSGKTVKKTNDKKAAGNVLPETVVKVLEEDCLALVTKLITNIYEPGDWPKEIPHSTMIVVKYKPIVMKCRTIAQSASSHIQQRE